MDKLNKKNKHSRKGSSGASKYDANQNIISKAYGIYADLRRELADSKSKIAERLAILNQFADCDDPQRAWLLLEDYFEKHSLSRKDFPDTDWWSKLVSKKGNDRLEELAFLFIRSARAVPSELAQFADQERFLQVQKTEQENAIIEALENWLTPEYPTHIESAHSALKVLCDIKPAGENQFLNYLTVKVQLYKSNGNKEVLGLSQIIELAKKPSYEQEKFAREDKIFLKWISENVDSSEFNESGEFLLSGARLLKWLSRWGTEERIEFETQPCILQFNGEVAKVIPAVEKVNDSINLSFKVKLPDGVLLPISEVKFFDGYPTVILARNKFYILEKNPPRAFFDFLAQKMELPISRLSKRARTKLRKVALIDGVELDKVCVVHPAKPRFIFELQDDIVRLRLYAVSESDNSLWRWNGYEWLKEEPYPGQTDVPESVDDPRLDDAILWLRRLDWFMFEPGVWTGDATEPFIMALASAWTLRPKDAEYFGNPAFQRLFLAPRQLRPRVIMRGSGIDWLSVSAEWEAEGLKLSKADLERLAVATSRFVKLPDAGWVELDIEAVTEAHEIMADLGVEGLTAVPEKIAVEQAAHLDDTWLSKLGNKEELSELRNKLRNFCGIPEFPLPDTLKATLRSYQKEGFNFLCHLTRLGLGGILADDMGLGKTVQTLAWIAWIKQQKGSNYCPTLVICPASVLHNWRREAERFTPSLSVLVLESGSARHDMRKKIPHYDIVITNYALLRRDLDELLKFKFGVVVLDEAQYIKNPSAQITQSVKQLKAEQRLALTGTPLENRLLDLWSIVDFVQPGYLGTQEHFLQTYDPPMSGNDEEAIARMRIARRRLSAKLRPIMIRRLKQQVADDLPDRIEERRDCELNDVQRKLYLAELKRSREQITQVLIEKGFKRSKIHILAALTRLRQICCHPALVGSDAPSGKTETLFELLEPLIAEGHKVLLFSQFVQMLKILEIECKNRGIPTHILTGETKERMAVVNAFQTDPTPSVFLLSLRAAGTGLNLTTASYVILYDPWWNPAVEAQAIDRSHRIGQTRTVNAYRLISPGTVEEKIWELQQRKAQTIADVLGEEGFARSLTQSDIEYLFAED